MTGRAITAKPARALSLVERTADALGRVIVHGINGLDMLLPPEGELSRSLGVGRNVVRDAIKILGAKGVVRVARGSGTPVLPECDWNYFDQQVIDWTLESHDLRDTLVDDVGALRFIIEPEIAAMAAASATTTEILPLFEECDLMAAELDAAIREIEADILFHRRLFEACHNRLMMGFLKAVVTVLRSNFELAINADHMIARYFEEHREVAKAIRRRDPDAARTVMRALLRANARNILEMRAKFVTLSAVER